jgi:hypothetical protein
VHTLTGSWDVLSIFFYIAMSVLSVETLEAWQLLKFCVVLVVESKRPSRMVYESLEVGHEFLLYCYVNAALMYSCLTFLYSSRKMSKYSVSVAFVCCSCENDKLIDLHPFYFAVGVQSKVLNRGFACRSL